MVYSPQVFELEPQVHLRRRSYPRQTLRSLAYVKLDHGNGGIVRDLTETGMAVQAVAPLRAGEEVGLGHQERRLIAAPRVSVDTHACGVH